MAQVEKTIEEIKNAVVCIELFNKERLGFAMEMNKNARVLKSKIKDHEAEVVSLRESFFEEADKKLLEKAKPKGTKTKADIVDENKPVYKKYIFVRKGKSAEAKRDDKGNMIELLPGKESAPGEFAFNAIPDDRLPEYLEAYTKLMSTPYTLDMHQISNLDLEEKILNKEEKTGESIDGNITEPLMDFIFVEEVQR